MSLQLPEHGVFLSIIVTALTLEESSVKTKIVPSKGWSPAMQEMSAPVSNSPDISFPWIKRSLEGLEAVISCAQKPRSLERNTLWPLAWEVKIFFFFFLFDNKLKAKAVLFFDLY